jgi:hypothetical protein
VIFKLYSGIADVLSCLARQVTRTDQIRSSRESSRRSSEVVWPTDKVCWVHYQVGGSSGRPDPLVGDGREPGRGEPRGTHVSQAPERCVGAATSRGS